MPVNENLLRELTVKVNNGSGCLFQPAGAPELYVLTVRHNIVDGETNAFYSNIKVSRLYPDPAINFTVLNKFLHSDITLDLAIILVEKPEGFELPPFNYAKANRKEKLRIIGYPKHKDKSTVPDKLGTLIAEVGLNASINNYIFGITSNTPLITFDQSAQATMDGFSGSGLFDEESEAPLLKGIFPSLGDPQGTLNSLNAIQIEAFNSIIEQNGLFKLIPKCLVSFEDYVENSFNQFSNQIKTGLKKIFQEKGSSISPEKITDKLKDKLFIPHKAKYNNHLIDVELWKGWLILLSFLWILDETEIEIDEVINILKTEDDIRLRYFHTDNNNHMEDIIFHLLNDTYSSIEPNENIIIHSSPAPLITQYSKEELKNIITNICANNTEILFNNDIDIDRPDSIKPLNIVHLRYLEEQVARTGSLSSIAAFKQAVKEKLKSCLIYPIKKNE